MNNIDHNNELNSRGPLISCIVMTLYAKSDQNNQFLFALNEWDSSWLSCSFGLLLLYFEHPLTLLKAIDKQQQQQQ